MALLSSLLSLPLLHFWLVWAYGVAPAGSSSFPPSVLPHPPRTMQYSVKAEFTVLLMDKDCLWGEGGGGGRGKQTRWVRGCLAD